MIKINITKKNGEIINISMKGHANQADYGRDIVCAGVSSILTTTVNAILSFDNLAIKVEENNPFFLSVLKNDEVTSKLLKNMVSLFYELEETYPKNINIREDETDE